MESVAMACAVEWPGRCRGYGPWGSGTSGRYRGGEGVQPQPPIHEHVQSQLGHAWRPKMARRHASQQFLDRAVASLWLLSVYDCDRRCDGHGKLRASVQRHALAACVTLWVGRHVMAAGTLA